MKTTMLGADDESNIADAVELLLRGRLVAVPTETVYGLAADASNDEAVVSVFEAKGRPKTHPLIVHVADLANARILSRNWTPTAEVLARAYWPGPLSILTERTDALSPLVTGGRRTVVVRVPDHPATLRLLSALHKRGSVGVAAPSANRFGSISPTTAAHVLSDLTGRVDAILDGGPCRVGVESTIVDCTKEPAAILRHGGISVEDISACLIEHGLAVMASDDEVGTVDTEKAIAPGMLRSHYAPRTKLLVFSTHAEVEAARRGAEARGKKVAVLPHDDDSYEYSRNLYSSLRRCDDEHADIIVALLPRPTGLGAAVRDRLLKAAAER